MTTLPPQAEAIVNELSLPCTPLSQAQQEAIRRFFIKWHLRRTWRVFV